MEKFAALQKFLEEKNLVPGGKFDAWIEGGEITRIGKDTPEGFHLLDYEYVAVFDFEECKQHPLFITSLVQCWLTDNDTGRRDEILGKVKMNITQESKGCHSIDVQIKFKEAAYIYQDDNGHIPYKGKMWTGGAVAAAIVEGFELEETWLMSVLILKTC